MESATTTRPVERPPAAPLPSPSERLRQPQRRWSRRRLREVAATARDYVSLTKPRIISLLLVTTVATRFVADPSGPSLGVILWTMLGGYLAAGGAGAINHYLDRERVERVGAERPGRRGPADERRHRPRPPR